uniref:Uncharacterized protein n=1 Tax=Chromera velia CCMP2878 TaxID=1169474 RepID=A0A0G4GT56_9ALVE|eukprot:Cvel_23200.t1-p1 / transcript=Cvel_23200.t1 / gene=Cvel_23200 / organism=Chromera_velia_CCMP2878 / gene_product=hypothetical protein / transcript_product=hypothetical protein / location=Cvel_scaffold2364:19535-21564(-) / protein_length=312 / sequence_SO=supercontig / SO=protein_coding / is_pseudo=false
MSPFGNSMHVGKGSQGPYLGIIKRLVAPGFQLGQNRIPAEYGYSHVSFLTRRVEERGLSPLRDRDNVDVQERERPVRVGGMTTSAAQEEAKQRSNAAAFQNSMQPVNPTFSAVPSGILHPSGSSPTLHPNEEKEGQACRLHKQTCCKGLSVSLVIALVRERAAEVLQNFAAEASCCVRWMVQEGVASEITEMKGVEAGGLTVHFALESMKKWRKRGEGADRKELVGPCAPVPVGVAVGLSFGGGMGTGKGKEIWGAAVESFDVVLSGEGREKGGKEMGRARALWPFFKGDSCVCVVPVSKKKECRTACRLWK